MSINGTTVSSDQDKGVSLNADKAEAYSFLSLAKQHLKAATVLGAFDGVALPQVHNAALSIELYFKALAVHAGDETGGDSNWRLDDLAYALHMLPEQIRSILSSHFIHHHGVPLEEQLSKFSKAFTQIRHHHQMPDFYEGFDLHEFMQLARFFGGMELPSEMPESSC